MAAESPITAQLGIPKRREYLTPVHGVLNVLHVLATHALLVASFVVGYLFLPFVLYVPATIVACIIHQRSMSEWIHEGAHSNFLSNKAWNDWLTDGLAGIWFLLPVDAYRTIHLQHHRQSDFFVSDDPDTVFLEVDTRRSFQWGVIRDVTGLTMVSQFLRFGNDARRSMRDNLFRLVSLLAVGAVTVLAWYLGRLDALIIYYGTLALLYPLHNRLRTYGQHIAIEPDGTSLVARSTVSRTIDAGLLDQILHTSPRLMYHHEHHRYPQLPYRALRRITVPSTDRNAYVTSRWKTLRAIYSGLPRTQSDLAAAQTEH